MICNPLAAQPFNTNMFKKERHAFIMKQSAKQGALR